MIKSADYSLRAEGDGTICSFIYWFMSFNGGILPMIRCYERIQIVFVSLLINVNRDSAATPTERIRRVPKSSLPSCSCSIQNEHFCLGKYFNIVRSEWQ